MIANPLRFALAGGVICAGLTGAQASADVLNVNMTADNAFYAFVSTTNASLGAELGSGNYWGTTSSFSSANLGPGTYYLQIEAINGGGPGAILGSFSVGSQSFVTGTTGWSVGYNDSFSDYNNPAIQTPWVTPTSTSLRSLGAVGVGPWDPASNYPLIDPTAQWIDGAAGGGNSLSDCGNCTVDFSYQFTIAGAPGPTPGAGLAGLAALMLAAGYSKLRATRA